MFATRTVTYRYDGLSRLTGAVEGGFTSNSDAYAYDLAGNRTGATVNGPALSAAEGVTTSRSYTAANQVVGWSYDAAGNLLSDGTTTSTYDALGRTVSQSGTSSQDNGDGVLVQAGTITSTQDLASPLSQILSDGSASYVYGRDRLTSSAGVWYLGDGLGSVRQTLDASGAVTAAASYDPWGVPQGNTIAPFGFTGEAQDDRGMVSLRARWYDPRSSTFTSRDSFAGWPEQPYTLSYYQYGYSDPVLNTDPTGRVVPVPVHVSCPIFYTLDPKDGLCHRDPGAPSWLPVTLDPSGWMILPVPSLGMVASGPSMVGEAAGAIGEAAGAIGEAAVNAGKGLITVCIAAAVGYGASQAIHSDPGGMPAPNPPAPTPPPGISQENLVRSQLEKEYDQPFGKTDDAIRANLNLGRTSKSADFVGQHRTSGDWLVAESKGNHVDTALQQLKRTMDGLTGTNPSAVGRIELRIYTNAQQYAKATDYSRNGLGGYFVDSDGYLVYRPGTEFVRETVNGQPVRVFLSP